MKGTGHRAQGTEHRAQSTEHRAVLLKLPFRISHPYMINI